jgi:hypothetical protein
MKTKWGRDAICGITHTRLRPGKYSNGSRRCIFLNCKHGFYTKPLLLWFDKDPHTIPTCPLCRQDIKEDIILKIFQ